jgi:hypothetical protein
LILPYEQFPEFAARLPQPVHRETIGRYFLTLSAGKALPQAEEERKGDP